MCSTVVLQVFSLICFRATFSKRVHQIASRDFWSWSVFVSYGQVLVKSTLANSQFFSLRITVFKETLSWTTISFDVREGTILTNANKFLSETAFGLPPLFIFTDKVVRVKLTLPELDHMKQIQISFKSLLKRSDWLFFENVALKQINVKLATLQLKT